MNEKRSRGNRPKAGYRWPKNQDERRVKAIAHAEQIIKKLDEVAAILGRDYPEARVSIAIAQRMSNDIRIEMIEAQYGPEQPEPAKDEAS